MFADRNVEYRCLRVGAHAGLERRKTGLLFSGALQAALQTEVVVCRGETVGRSGSLLRPLRSQAAKAGLSPEKDQEWKQPLHEQVRALSPCSQHCHHCLAPTSWKSQMEHQCFLAYVLMASLRSKPTVGNVSSVVT